MKISDIKVNFGGKHGPKDEKLIDLLRKAYSGEILCFVATIKSDYIKPFSDFKPETSAGFEKYFLDKEKTGTPPPLYVYLENGKFIMSDDFNSYYLYKKLNYQYIPCIVLGEAESNGISVKSDPFKLPTPGT